MADLYDAAILAEAKANHAAGRLPEPRLTATCDNPLCGDRVTIDLRLEDGRIAAIAQHTRGCLLTQAAASLIAHHAVGATPADIAAARDQLRALLAGEAVGPSWPQLEMFAPVRDVRSRHDCVLLPFEAMAEALKASTSADLP